MRILLIEDEEDIAAMIRRGLENAKYRVDHAADGQTGLEMACENSYGLVILDLMLPRMDGWTVCQKLRSDGNGVPILMLTARDAVEDRVRGLDAGADDYLPKPFSFSEFFARVRALLRRDRVHRARVIRVGDLEIDIAQRLVTRGGKPLVLSAREFDLLAALAANEGRVLSREAIQERVWMNEEAVSTIVDVYIGLLRKKLDTGHDDKLIQTIKGVGYTLRAPRPQAESEASR